MLDRSKPDMKLLGAGSHSGVKLCRWTKSMLRGRGGCYKHAFYGIESHRCMEATPSLACANKCVFCWRHHTNPGARLSISHQQPLWPAFSIVTWAALPSRNLCSIQMGSGLSFHACAVCGPILMLHFEAGDIWH